MSNSEKSRERVHELIGQAVEAVGKNGPGTALTISQIALNCANAIAVMERYAFLKAARDQPEAPDSETEHNDNQPFDFLKAARDQIQLPDRK